MVTGDWDENERAIVHPLETGRISQRSRHLAGEADGAFPAWQRQCVRFGATGCWAIPSGGSWG